MSHSPAHFIKRYSIFAFDDQFIMDVTADEKTRQIFDWVEYDRKVRKVKSTVEDYLVAEINIANNNI